MFDDHGALITGSIHEGSRRIQATKDGKLQVEPLTAEKATTIPGMSTYHIKQHTLIEGDAKVIATLAGMSLEEVAVHGSPK